MQKEVRHDHIISGLTGGHNTDSLSKEKAVFYDLELLYNVKRLTAPGNRTPPFAKKVAVILTNLSLLIKYEKKGTNMKNILVALTLMVFSTSAFAGSCPMMAGKVKSKIEQAQKLHDAGMKAHSDGDHSKSEQLLNEALDLFKS